MTERSEHGGWARCARVKRGQCCRFRRSAEERLCLCLPTITAQLLRLLLQVLKPSYGSLLMLPYDLYWYAEQDRVRTIAHDRGSFERVVFDTRAPFGTRSHQAENSVGDAETAKLCNDITDDPS